jgi:hypothetical protein
MSLIKGTSISIKKDYPKHYGVKARDYETEKEVASKLDELNKKRIRLKKQETYKRLQKALAKKKGVDDSSNKLVKKLLKQKPLKQKWI